MNTNNQPLYGACAVIYRKADGTQHRIAALIPNEKVRQGYFDRAKQLGMEVEIKNINEYPST